MSAKARHYPISDATEPTFFAEKPGLFSCASISLRLQYSFFTSRVPAGKFSIRFPYPVPGLGVTFRKLRSGDRRKATQMKTATVERRRERRQQIENEKFASQAEREAVWNRRQGRRVLSWKCRSGDSFTMDFSFCKTVIVEFDHAADSTDDVPGPCRQAAIPDETFPTSGLELNVGSEIIRLSCCPLPVVLTS